MRELLQRELLQLAVAATVYSPHRAVSLPPRLTELSVQLDFDDLPEVCKRYTTLRATRIFQDRIVGSNTLHDFQVRDEERAMFELKEFDKAADDHNIFDNYDTFSIIDRQGRRTF